MNFSILQGDSPFAAKNYAIGDFVLEGIPAKPKGYWEV
jgi:molecular chaperone DnaK (HSP70)